MKVATSEEAGKLAHGLRIATAKAQASEKTAQAAKEQTGLAKIRFKAARRAYKKAKKAAKKAARRARQAQDELKTWTEKAAQGNQEEDYPEAEDISKKGQGQKGACEEKSAAAQKKSRPRPQPGFLRPAQSLWQPKRASREAISQPVKNVLAVESREL